MSTFPFLKIARDYGRPYGDVIRHAEWFDQKRTAWMAEVPISNPPPLFHEKTRSASLS
jgi:hypothetical protein